MSFQPRHLGKSSNQPVDEIDLIPWTGSKILVRLDCSELTSLCPVTGHPDFATLEIRYVPDQHLVETKSMKLYLWRYRERPTFNEVLVDEVAGDLFQQLAPLWLKVTGRFHPRGGIAVTVDAERGESRHLPASGDQ
ncbi:MAG: preQ(1) synthase [Acidobacteriota bacterium]